MTNAEMMRLEMLNIHHGTKNQNPPTNNLDMKFSFSMRATIPFIIY